MILLYLFIGFCLGAAFVVFWMVALSDKLQRMEETMTYEEKAQKNWEELCKYRESLDIIKAHAEGYENAGEHDMALGLRLIF